MVQALTSERDEIAGRLEAEGWNILHQYDISEVDVQVWALTAEPETQRGEKLEHAGAAQGFLELDEQ
jgi:hypothetical protein